MYTCVDIVLYMLPTDTYMPNSALMCDYTWHATDTYMPNSALMCDYTCYLLTHTCLIVH